MMGPINSGATNVPCVFIMSGSIYGPMIGAHTLPLAVCQYTIGFQDVPEREDLDASREFARASRQVALGSIANAKGYRTRCCTNNRLRQINKRVFCIFRQPRCIILNLSATPPSSGPWQRAHQEPVCGSSSILPCTRPACHDVNLGKTTHLNGVSVRCRSSVGL